MKMLWSGIKSIINAKKKSANLISSLTDKDGNSVGVVQNHRPPPTNQPPTTDHRPPTTDHEQPTTDHILIKTPTTDHSQK